MAGSLYLGSQKVCPAIVTGGGIEVGLEVDQDGKLTIQETGDVVFSGFTDVGDYIFRDMFSHLPITSVDLSNLVTISGYKACSGMFFGCPLLTFIDLSNLETISGYEACSGMFYLCKSLKSLSFKSLKTISGTNAFSNILGICSDVTMHFPSNMESTIAGLNGYPNFGGTNTTLLFDLEPTEN